MTAYNVVRMRVKPGRNADYLEAHRAIDRDTFAGMRSVAPSSRPASATSV